MPATIVVCGAPHAGKSTYARAIASAGCKLVHLDSLIAGHAWSEQSDIASRYFDAPTESMIIEGCAAVRALRKWLERNPTGRPCERVIRLTTPFIPHSAGQARLAAGESTIWEQVYPQLLARGVAVQIGG